MSTPLFELGIVVATPGALRALEMNSVQPNELIFRRLMGDWGDLGEDDKALNDQAIEDGSRILSAYELSDGNRIWIITESDRSATTLLLPEEY